MHISNGSTEASAGTTWTTLGTFSSTLTSSNWSYSSNTLTAANTDAVEGEYLIKYSLSFNADPALWSIGLSINGNDPTEPIFTRSIGTGKDLDHGNVSGVILVNIVKTQTIELKIMNDTGTLNYTPVHAQVVAVKVGQTSVNYYGGMYLTADPVDPNFPSLCDPAGTFVKLTGFSAMDEINGWSFSSSELTAGSSSAGIYYATLSVCFTGDENGSNIIDCSFRVAKNGNPVDIFAVRKTGSTDIGNISAVGLISISDSDVITLEATQSIKNLDLTVRRATLSLYKIVDSTSGAYAGMKITGDQSITISAQDTWTTVGTLTSDASNGWSFSNNVFTPSSTSTYGYSCIDYSLSFSTANATGDDLEFGVFIRDKTHPEFKIIRKLSSNTSVGAASGNGMFLVDGPDSTIVLKVRNTTSASNVTVKKCYLASHQFRYVYSDTPLPICLSNFTAVQDNSLVKLSWKTASETDNAYFLIYRNEELIASIDGAGTTSEPNDYRFTDPYVIPGMTYTYTLADVSFANVEVKHDDKAVTITIDQTMIGKDYSIGKAYPNPFNPSTIIPLNLAREADINVTLYDIKGKAVQEIFKGSLAAGSYDLKIKGHELPAGIYFVKINIQEEAFYSKVTLLK